MDSYENIIDQAHKAGMDVVEHSFRNDTIKGLYCDGTAAINKNIETTVERGLLAGIVPVEDIVYRDTESYFGILYTNNNRKPICRLNLDTKNKQLLIPDENKKFDRIYIQSLNDIYQYRDRLTEVVKRYL